MTGGVFGIAGTDHRSRVEQAMFGIAGDIRGRVLEGVQVGLDQEAARLTDHIRVREGQLPHRHRSNRLGESMAARPWQHAVWFADFSYLVSPFAGSTTGQLCWRANMELIFGRSFRTLPVFIDCAGYRREISGTAQDWTHHFPHYPAAIEIIDPDGYAAFDYPKNKRKTLAYLRKLESIFPGDTRLWPVFSSIWTWQKSPHLDFTKLPGWAAQDLSWFIPLTRTQRRYRPATLERYARLAIANALLLGTDPDFKQMVDRYGKVMVGGLAACGCPRPARHLYAAVLHRMYPGLQLWLLGQASAPVFNGLGMLELLDRTSTDGTNWLLNSLLDRIPILENGLLVTFNDVESKYQSQLFFVAVEMMAAWLRSWNAVYSGALNFPDPQFDTVNLYDHQTRVALDQHLKNCHSDMAQQMRLL